jgi:uncharacterized UPF0160 family protein
VVNIRKIITHGDAFHLPDVASVVVAAKVFPKATIIRTNSADDLEMAFKTAYECLFIETGYDLDRPFVARLNEIPYSTFGHIWDDYGIDFVKAVLEEHSFPNITPAFAFRIARAIEKRWTYAIDVEATAMPSFEQFPDVAPLTLRYVIESMNPAVESDDGNDAAFREAMRVFRDVLTADILRHAQMFRIGDAVDRAIDNWSGDPIDPVVFDENVNFWREQVCALDALFVVMPWFEEKWQALPVQERPDTWRVRAKAPKEWHGLEAEKFAQATGVADAFSCHCQGYAFSAKSASGAIALARLAAKAHLEAKAAEAANDV